MTSHLPAVRKTIAAVIGAIATWGLAASPDGIQTQEWWGLVAAIGTILGVYGVRNEPAPDAPPGDAGAVTLTTVVLVLGGIALSIWILDYIDFIQPR